MVSLSLDRVLRRSTTGAVFARQRDSRAQSASPSAHGGAGNGTIAVLQLGRALAALSVVMMHVVLPTEKLVAPIPEGMRAAMEHGYLGVDFFFVLSGFIIFWTNHSIFTREGWSARYLSSRLTRIYLPYLPVAVALALAYTLLPGMITGNTPWSWAATFTLLPGIAPSALGVAWTLSYELMFYALALLFFRSGEPLAWASLWAVAIVMRHVAGAPFGPAPDLSWESMLLNPLNLEFVFGMYAAKIVIDGQVRSNLLFWIAGTLCIATFAIDGMDRASAHIFGLGLAFILVPLIRMELDGRLRIGAWALLLGNASYAIYLLHMPLLSLTTRIVARLGAFATWQTSLILGLATSVAAAIGYHLLYERPALALARRRTAGASA
jgi:peptidoglycan/LPS O-acetylase OafA/YrhL